jgi:NhaA family Na+:H+ antiporter
MNDGSSPAAPRSSVLLRARATLDEFFRLEAASGIVLMAAAAVALLWANSDGFELYRWIFHTKLELEIAGVNVGRSLGWLIDDGLMSIFFFVVGLEIRGEVEHGELADLRRAALPIGAALGGVACPAVIYLLSSSNAERAGWGVPMATDIAFALGILTLLGRRIPPALRILLLAVAIIDDLMAILVIAFFYSAGLAWSNLALVGAGIGGIVGLQRLRVSTKLAYVLPSLLTWLGVYKLGVHPTIAGVVIGLLTPTQSFSAGASNDESPAKSLLHTLHPWVAFGIMPLFALGNAGVNVSGLALDDGARRIIFGIGAGLLLGKPAGVLLGVLSLRLLGAATLPAGLGLRHVLVLGVVAGVGFTMALFIAQLAFAEDSQLAAAKLGVLVASGLAAVATLLLGRVLLEPAPVAAQAKLPLDEPTSPRG